MAFGQPQAFAQPMAFGQPQAFAQPMAFGQPQAFVQSQMGGFQPMTGITGTVSPIQQQPIAQGFPVAAPQQGVADPAGTSNLLNTMGSVIQTLTLILNTLINRQQGAQQQPVQQQPVQQAPVQPAPAQQPAQAADAQKQFMPIMLTMMTLMLQMILQAGNQPQTARQ